MLPLTRHKTADAIQVGRRRGSGLVPVADRASPGYLGAAVPSMDPTHAPVARCEVSPTRRASRFEYVLGHCLDHDAALLRARTTGYRRRRLQDPRCQSASGVDTGPGPIRRSLIRLVGGEDPMNLCGSGVRFFSGGQPCGGLQEGQSSTSSGRQVRHLSPAPSIIRLDWLVAMRTLIRFSAECDPRQPD